MPTKSETKITSQCFKLVASKYQMGSSFKSLRDSPATYKANNLFSSKMLKKKTSAAYTL